MAVRINVECDVCEADLNNGYSSGGGYKDLDAAPGLVRREANGEGWLVAEGYVLCAGCKRTVEALGYTAPGVDV